MERFLTPEIINIVILPVLIFCVRIADVGMGTMRIIFVSRGVRFMPAILGFFEVLIWLFAISQIMQHLNSPVHYIAYAAGFGMGNFVGISIERRLSFGHRTVRVVTGREEADRLAQMFREAGYGVTSIDGDGVGGPVKLIFTVVKRNQVDKIVNIIRQTNPRSFYTVEEIKYVDDQNVYPVEDSYMTMFRKIGSFLANKK